MSNKQDKLKRISEVMGMIAEDMESDVKRWADAPFTGKTLGTIHGELCATIQAVANAVKVLADEELTDENN